MEDRFITLYNYLGKAAGRKLGKTVCMEAVRLKEPIKEIPVSNSTYEGDVHAYRESFLNTYFEK
jgi:hypothetical protein